MREIMVLGCGISGRGAAKLAAEKGYKVILVDGADTEGLRRFAESIPGSESCFGWKEGMFLPHADIGVLSPGISIRSPMANAAGKSCTELTGELGFAFRHTKCPVIAITGTNGKTTTTELTTQLFRAAGYKAESAGNIGLSLSEAVLNSLKHPLDYLVVETSSFQLESVSDYHPAAAALLNIASDHINRHGSMEEYTKVKFSVFGNCSDHAILNTELLDEWHCRYPDAPAPITFSAKCVQADFMLQNDFICCRGRKIFERNSSPLPGSHNTENIMAALALLLSVAGEKALFKPEISTVLRDFRPDAHRLEFFAEKNGIRYCDDSKATNPHSTVAALRSIGKEQNIILLLGGLDKNMDFHELDVCKETVRKAFLYGECRKKIASALAGNFDCTVCSTFEETVSNACFCARTGETVLLSPACASMDLFKNYAHRGERFKELVLKEIEKD